ncbi:MAG: arsenate reductase family protein [Oscillospiraceae bacterium]|nr:arsenate reductase family protein [Oscillospiraceae bacterium]
MTLFVCYPKCSTCKKAAQWLTGKGIDCVSRDIRLDRPSLEELSRWQELSGLPMKKFFNTSGQQYKALGLKDRLPTMSRQEQLELLSSDGMLVKRPILVREDTVLVGFRESAWEQALL